MLAAAPVLTAALAPLLAAAPPIGTSPADATPRWIWAAGAVDDGDAVRLRKDFAAGGRNKFRGAIKSG